jgi:PPOX class probable F420-dependent enzyme
MSAARRDGLVIHTRGTAGFEPALDPRLEDLLRRHRDALIATTGRDGAPQLTPVWYLWDGTALSASVPGWTVKVGNIRRQPRVAVCVDDEVAGAYATASGAAELIEAPADGDREVVRAATWPLLLKYLPEDEAAARWSRIDAAGDRVVIRLVPERILWRTGVR